MNADAGDAGYASDHPGAVDRSALTESAPGGKSKACHLPVGVQECCRRAISGIRDPGYLSVVVDGFPETATSTERPKIGQRVLLCVSARDG
jgi:hypothetical protein